MATISDEQASAIIDSAAAIERARAEVEEAWRRYVNRETCSGPGSQKARAAWLTFCEARERKERLQEEAASTEGAQQ